MKTLTLNKKELEYLRSILSKDECKLLREFDYNVLDGKAEKNYSNHDKLYKELMTTNLYIAKTIKKHLGEDI
tara:strand:- start:1616 stop:1831 length:216 start_codon:yes stop_codon:yes gene_type:complete